MINIEDTIQRLMDLDVHDLDFCGLQMDFQENSILVRLENAGSPETESYSVRFKGVWAFASHYPPNMIFAPQECFGISVSPETGRGYLAVIVANLDERPLWEIKIGFAGLEITDGAV